MLDPKVRPMPEDKDELINWYENEIQRFRLEAEQQPVETGPLNGPILSEDEIVKQPVNNEAAIEHLTSLLDALKNS